jgi:hypothetical protein
MKNTAMKECSRPTETRAGWSSLSGRSTTVFVVGVALSAAALLATAAPAVAGIHHLDRAGIARRRVVRKMTDESVALAAARYEQGASLAVVASEFGVHQRTLAMELRRAGVLIRPRHGRHR